MNHFISSVHEINKLAEQLNRTLTNSIPYLFYENAPYELIRSKKINIDRNAVNKFEVSLVAKSEETNWYRFWTERKKERIRVIISNENTTN